MKKSDVAKAEAIARLREWVKPGDTLHTILRHCSRSGMSRTIQVVKIDSDGRPLYLGRNIADAVGMTYDHKREGVKVGGCGMDMGFHLVYGVAATLFPAGFGCIGDRCPSNDHSNGDRDHTPNRNEGITSDKDGNQREVNTHWHTSGGYALVHRWM